VVQDPADAMFPSMPQSALRHVDVDHSVPLSELAPLLTQLASAAVDSSARPAVPKDVEVEVKIAREDNAVESGVEELGEPSQFACPECHGVLLRLKHGNPVRFRCHTGHAYSADSLLAAVNEGIEDALWNAVRALEEGRLLLQHLADHSHLRGGDEAAAMFNEQVSSAKKQMEAVRTVVTERAGLVAPRQLSSTHK
jgi:two-component system chemotaxis response regulator CheB